jgi:GrpB-like predicted nucleotidyltransferase (UPF0157 family)
VGRIEDEIRVEAEDALDSMDGLDVRRMFSGWGFYSHGLLFAAAWKGEFRFRTRQEGHWVYEGVDRALLDRPDELVTAARTVIATLAAEPAARPRPRRRAADQAVSIEPYRPDWPVAFEAERRLLEPVIGEYLVGGIHHVGSTAVPNLPAEPIIDILAGIHDLDNARPCIELVAPLGYVYVPYLAEEMHWFRKPHSSRRTHHLHLVPVGSPRYRDELRFRDYLREHRSSRDEYARLKRGLGMKFRRDRDGYTEGKTEFVRDVLRRTDAEAAS